MNPSAALIIVDPQIDFCPGGALAVAEGDAIIPLANDLAAKFSTVVVTQDWHPADHTSFAANHPGQQPFESTDLFYGPQILWPVHCVQGSPGAGFHPGLDLNLAHLIIRKGANPAIDSYSAFLEADRATKTGLDGYLTSRGITDVYVASPQITASFGRHWMRDGSDFARWLWRMPAGASILMSRLPHHGRR